MKKQLLDKMTGHQFSIGKYDKVILPVGSLENHGFHLPFGTDTFVSHQLAQKVAEQIPGLLVMPPVTYGMSEHYSSFAFTASLQAETLIAVLKDILLSVLRNGIEKIFIMNGHDGNIAPIEIAARAVKKEYPTAKIVSLDAWWVVAGQLLPPDTFEVWNGLGHAGEGETSMALALFPELVEMDKAKGVVPDLPLNVEIKWLFNELTDTGATGDPTKATKEKGEKMRDVLVEAVVGFMKQMEEKDWKY